MSSNDEKVRATIAEQAAEWLPAKGGGATQPRETPAPTPLLKGPPGNVQEFLGVSVIARDLREAGIDPEYSLETVLARARAQDESPVQPLWPRLIGAVGGQSSRGWLTAGVMAAGLGVLGLGFFFLGQCRTSG